MRNPVLAIAGISGPVSLAKRGRLARTLKRKGLIPKEKEKWVGPMTITLLS